MELDVSRHLALDVIVPSKTGLDLAAAVKQNGDQILISGALGASIKQRSYLLLDETVKAYAVLWSPLWADNAVSSLLPRLKGQIEVVATGAPIESLIRPNDPTGRVAPSHPATEVIQKVIFGASDQPIRVVLDSEPGPDDGDDNANPDTETAVSGHAGYVLRFWPLDIHLNRPRARMQKMTVTLRAAAVFSAERDGKASRPSDYLPSGVAAPPNLLEPLTIEPGLVGVAPTLSADRITKMVPPSRTDAGVSYPIPVTDPAPTIPAGPLLLWRLRYLKAQQPPKTNSLIACVDVEVSHFLPAVVTVESIRLVLSAGRVSALDGSGSGNMPFECVNGDHVSRLYRLDPDPDLTERMSNESREHRLSLELEARVRNVDEDKGKQGGEGDGVDNGKHSDSDASSRVHIRWSMNVDFATETKFGHQRARSAVLNQMTSIEMPRTGSVTTATHGRRSVVGPFVGGGRSSSVVESQHTLRPGVVFTIRGPAAVTVGQPFSWKILVINRSDSPVRFELYVLPVRTGGYGRRPDGRDTISGPPHPQAPTDGMIDHHRHHPNRHVLTRPGGGTTKGGPSSEWIPDPVVGQNILYADHKSAELNRADLICLSAETRIGPLGPSACFSADVEFVALVTGVLRVEAIRLVDMASQQVVDIRDVPDIIAQAE